MTEKTLVTGATGFIGRALCKALADAGHCVCATYIEDELPDGLDPRIEWVKTAPLGPETDWAAALAEVTHVMHLAGLAHSAAETASEAELMLTNSIGTKRLVEAAEATCVRRLVLMSSVAAVVGTDAGFVDEDSPARPASSYGQSKLAAEEAVRTTLSSSRCEYVIVRPTLVYGQGNPGNMRRLQNWIARRIPMPFASLDNQRTFCFLGNVVSALCTVRTHPGAANQVFTVCDNEAVSTPELIRKIGQLSGRKPWLFPAPHQVLSGTAALCDCLEAITRRELPFDSDKWLRISGSLVGSNTKLRQRCDWTPPFSLEDGLRETFCAGSSRRAQ